MQLQKLLKEVTYSIITSNIGKLNRRNYTSHQQIVIESLLMTNFYMSQGKEIGDIISKSALQLLMYFGINTKYQSCYLSGKLKEKL